VADGSARGPSLRDLESLRIERPEAPAPARRLRLVGAILATAVALTLAGYALYSRTLNRPIAVQTAPVIMRGGNQPGILLTGSGYVVTQHKYIVIGTKILGQIVEEPIEEGQHVRRGDLLARIDDRDYEAQLNQALADRDQAAADIKLKSAQMIRMRELFRNNAASRDQLDLAENAAAVASASLERAQAAIDYARFNVSQCIITSPIDGIVLQKYREVGSTINYGGDVQAGGGTTDIVQLADTSDMRTEVDINESDIAKVTMGQPATVIPDAYPDQAFVAFVAKIYPAADRQKGTVKVEVKLRDPDLRIIKPEMSAKVSFLARAETTQSSPLFIVPSKAIVPQGTSHAVWIVRESTAHEVEVTPGRELQDGVEIRRGLDGGEIVIVDPPAALKEGARVTTKGR
jgi:RND family efflux transporter MFP subunit